MTEMMGEHLVRIQLRLGYQFRNEELLRLALVNSTARGSNGDNRRLAYLGDAVVGLAAARLVFDRYPEAEKGPLTEERKSFVADERLLHVSRYLGVDEPGVILKGGAAQASGDATAQAEAVEALLGAVYVDAEPAHALDVTRRLLEAVFPPRPPAVVTIGSTP